MNFMFAKINFSYSKNIQLFSNFWCVGKVHQIYRAILIHCDFPHLFYRDTSKVLEWVISNFEIVFDAYKCLFFIKSTFITFNKNCTFQNSLFIICATNFWRNLPINYQTTDLKVAKLYNWIILVFKTIS